MEKQEYQPYIPAEKVLPELTGTSALVGCLLAVIFGGANAYLGLRVGMTVSASIPAAVISMGIMRKVLKRKSVLENNMVQTIGSAGESVAAGAIFTLPVLFMWAEEGGNELPSLPEIGLVALCGGWLGVLLMIPLRNALIVKEHGVLPYPEGQACAQVLMAGEADSGKASVVFAGFGVSAIYKFLADGIKLFPSRVDYTIPAYQGAGIGLDVLPSLVGVGYICGAKVSSYLFAGGALAWLVIMPLIALFGGDLIIFPSEISVDALYAAEGNWGLWSTYVKYIGAGAVAAGGIFSLIKTMPLIMRTFWAAIRGYGAGGNGALRTQQELPVSVILVAVFLIFMLLWFSSAFSLNFFGAFIVIVFGFFFAAVSSRMVGLIGSSNNPVSGMSIATLLITALFLKALGNDGAAGMTTAILIGAFVSIISAIAGDASQDLKTGFLVGATPRKQQIGELLGCTVSAVAIGGILYLLHLAWGYGTTELPAAQATLMKVVVEGVMGGELPWTLVGIGACIALVVEILGIPVLPFVIGLYLPIHLSLPILAGGLVRLLVEKRYCEAERKKEHAVQTGVLYASGLIAGEGIVGILLAVWAVWPIGKNGVGAEWPGLYFGKTGGLFFFAVLLLSLWWFAWREGKDDL